MRSWNCSRKFTLEKGNDRIGQELLVMIEGKVSGESAYIGRTYGDAPKVDGLYVCSNRRTACYRRILQK